MHDFYAEQFGDEHGEAITELMGEYFRLAAIIQQIYKRYHAGETTNPRFKRFWIGVWWLHTAARQAMK